jgi:hypothetical protein
VQDVAGVEGDAAEGDGDVDGSGGVLGALAADGAPCLAAEALFGECGAVAEGAVQDEADPAVVLGGAGDEVADQGGAQGAASVDDDEGAVAGSVQQSRRSVHDRPTPPLDHVRSTASTERQTPVRFTSSMSDAAADVHHHPSPDNGSSA